MNTSPLYITREDYTKLRLLVAHALRSRATAPLENLREELDRAVVIDRTATPPGVAVMGSTVEYEDVGSREIESYTLVFPDQADIEARRISVLAPIGTALLGSRESELVTWHTPGGVRQLRILRVSGPAAPQPAPTRSVLEAVLGTNR